MTHIPNSSTESDIIKTEHEVHFYVERAHQLREETLNQMIADAGHAIASAFRRAKVWIAKRVHLIMQRSPSAHA